MSEESDIKNLHEEAIRRYARHNNELKKQEIAPHDIAEAMIGKVLGVNISYPWATLIDLEKPLIKGVKGIRFNFIHPL